MQRPGDLIGGTARLKRGTAELQRRWSETREHWDDQAARDFESQYLEAMLPTLRLVMGATTEMHERLRKAIAACEDSDRIVD